MEQLPKDMEGFQDLFDESDTTLSLEEDRITEYESSGEDERSSSSDRPFKFTPKK